uniref:DH domain-containing protein n=1 Tax=Latimeria chalumnae TaxID=7897 RepID=H3AXL6_LATCH
ITPQQHRLQETMFELIGSEASYLRSLTVAVNHFVKSKKLAEVLCSRDRHILFSNLQEVKDVSKRFLLDLEERLEEEVYLTDIGDIVLKHCPSFAKVYIPYVTNQMYQEQLIQQLVHENAKFLPVIRKLEEQSMCQRQLLKSFLILPFQRITRLKILLEKILKLTLPDTAEFESIRSALKVVGEIVFECNENIQKMKETEELVHLENQMVFLKTKSVPLIARGRHLIRQGELMQIVIQEVDGGYKVKPAMKPIYLHLFNDLLLLSRFLHRENKYHVLDYAKTSKVKAESFRAKCLGLPPTTFLVFLTENHERSFREIIVKASTECEKQEWITIIS